MSDYDNTNSGALFKNDKGDNDSRPDYKGSLNVSGVEMDLAAWLKVSKAGQKYMSLKLSPKRDAPADRAMNDEPESSIPF